MHEPTLGLASLQLADRQFAAWGHPETTGLPTIDGFLSAELFEPPDAEAHYSEKLVRLPNLGVFCEPYGVPAAALDLEGLGIERNGPICICPGVPFKYQPQDDWLFVEIAQRLGRCNFVFFQYEIAELSRKFQERVAAAFECAHLDPSRYLRFIPWQPREAFFGLLRQADVYLDTLGFSGFNTLIQAVECNLPCVTYDGRFMRGRLGSGILKRLGLMECVAADTSQYVDRAVELAANRNHNAHIRATMKQNESRLYGDLEAVGALSDYLLARGT
jgi:predicted O-linked N-acetylglucosamine transferase (SPINDLY family)